MIRTLAKREEEVVILLCHGLKRKEIAHRMGVVRGTVDLYMQYIHERWGVSTALEVVLYALKDGLVRLEDLPIGKEKVEPRRGRGRPRKISHE